MGESLQIISENRRGRSESDATIRGAAAVRVNALTAAEPTPRFRARRRVR